MHSNAPMGTASWTPPKPQLTIELDDSQTRHDAEYVVLHFVFTASYWTKSCSVAIDLPTEHYPSFNWAMRYTSENGVIHVIRYEGASQLVPLKALVDVLLTGTEARAKIRAIKFLREHVQAELNAPTPTKKTVIEL